MAVRKIPELTRPPEQIPIPTPVRRVITPEETIAVAETVRVNTYNRTTEYLKIAAEVVVGIVILWFGIYNAGSVFEMSSRMEGWLAVFFYTYQIGTLLEILGMIILYDSSQRIRCILTTSL